MRGLAHHLLACSEMEQPNERSLMMCRNHYQQELQRRHLPTLWEIPDPMWLSIQPLFPPEKAPGTDGRPAIPFRTVLNGILYVLRSGCQWKAAPARFSSGSTLHRRLQEWEQAGIFAAILARLLRIYDQVRGIDWRWQSADTKLLPAPLGGTATGPNPTDRAKSGTKRHLLIDGNGAPLGLHLSGANRPDMKGLAELLTAGLIIARPKPTRRKRQHLCLDKGYDYATIDDLLTSLGYTAHIGRRGQVDQHGIGETSKPPRRWKVERTISWMNTMRKLRTRWEKKAENYQALCMLSAALILHRLIVLG
jgi:putative transposase